MAPVSVELLKVKLELETVRAEVQQIQAYQKSIHQWLVAIGGQMGIRPSEE